MNYVLMLITVFTASNGLHTQTRFQEFGSHEACEQAARAIRDAVIGMKGTLGRDVIAQCHPLR